MKQIASIFLVLLTTLSLMAQTTHHVPSEAVKLEIAILQKADLNLNDVQITRITAVLMSYEQLYANGLKNLDGATTVLEARKKDLKDNKLKNVKGAMTPEQVKKFEALKLEEKFN